MPLSPSQKRACLDQLTATRLRELIAALDVTPASKRGKGDLAAALADVTTDFRSVLELLKLAELKKICAALELGDTGRVKEELIERILGGQAPTDTSASTSSTPPPMSAQSTGTLKSALRRFILDLAGGARGRDAPAVFVSRLLQCFGWPEAGPPGVTIPTSLSIVDHGEKSVRQVGLFWKERRVLVEVVKHDAILDAAWKNLHHVCLQVDPVPQYVVLTNQRDLRLYDLGRDRETPRLAIPIDDLPKYSEAFPFLSSEWKPGTTPKIINVSKVSREVADLVARLYNSLKEQHPTHEKEVVQFTLQCILAMFAEDIGLLPQEYFTSLLYEGARERDTAKRLAELFRLMSTRDVPGPRAVPFFNGGLFTNPVTLPLGDVQLAALTKASEANWKYVDPHIFGSVFQGIMNDAERHKSGAHYTAHDDIMRVVGPTIVDPWRQRIQSAKTLTELLELRTELHKFRVLDPACGSGNFLYVAFRELYRLDTELLARAREFPSTQTQGKARVSWSAGIRAANFFGIDINPFAVELAKVTLNIAKKIAFDERREIAADLVGQMELDVDPSLPLDNLESNIVCADALFSEWPAVDAIVGNPPFLGGNKLRRELGAPYVQELSARFPNAPGPADICVYWFRRAHDHLPMHGRAGLVGTSGIRVGKPREASLDYIVASDGTITNAVSSRPWQGEAAVNVSMVNWVRGESKGPHKLELDGTQFEVERIHPHLQLHADVTATPELTANAKGMSEGVGFRHPAFKWPDPAHLPSGNATRPLATADDLLRGHVANPDYCVWLVDCDSENDARAYGGSAFDHLKKHLYVFLKERAESGTETKHYETWLRKWWKPQHFPEAFLRTLSERRRTVVCSKVQSRPIFTFLSTKFVPTNTLQVFAFDDDYSFGILQSGLHWEWSKAKGGKVAERIRYTKDVWSTFPWPQEPSEGEVAAVAAAAVNLRRVRHELMNENGWSLRALHQAAEISGSHPLKDAQMKLDEAVRMAYGMPDDQDATEFLLELNNLVAEDEAQGRQVQGPGLARGLDPEDPRWTSDDCIQPPNL